MMQQELAAGSWKVIAEARESGNVGIYRPSTALALVLHFGQGSTRRHPLGSPTSLSKCGSSSSLAPTSTWGTWTHDVSPLECLRLGLRGDTFFDNLPEAMAEGVRQIPEDEILADD